MAKFTAEIIDISNESVRIKDSFGQTYSVSRNGELSVIESLSPGDQVSVEEIETVGGTTEYIITGHTRFSGVMAVIIIFACTIVLFQKKRGLISLLNILITFFILFAIIIPLLLKGFSPVPIAAVGGTIALAINILLSYGWSKKSLAAILGVLCTLVMIGVFSYVFVLLASLTGFADETVSILNVLETGVRDMRGLLLAAIMIGALGVLDDLAISQTSSVEELLAANPNIAKNELQKAAMRIGSDHTSAIVNTLIFAYAGAAFPLLILFSLGEPPFETLYDIFNHELVATEIVRTIAGTMGLVFAMPLMTWIAVKLYTRKK